MTAAYNRSVPRLRLRSPYDWPVAHQYLFGLSLVATSFVVRWLFDGMLGDRIPFTLTVGVLLPLVLLVRPMPFLVAVLIGWFGAVYLFVPPRFDIGAALPGDAVAMALYGVVLVLAFSAAHLSRRVADARDHERRQFRTLLEQAPIGVYVVDAELRIKEINAVAAAGFGGDRDTLLERALPDVLSSVCPPAHAAWVEQIFRDTLRTGTPAVLTPSTEEVRPQQDRDRFYDWRTDRVLLPDGRYGVVCYYTDVSEQVIARERVVESGEFLRVAKDAAQLGLHAYHVPSGNVEWDDRTRELWGIGPDQPITYEVWRDSLHPEDREDAEQAVARAIEPTGTGRYLAQYRVTCRIDGLTRWIEATGRTTFIDGQPFRLVGTVQDITDRRRMDQAIVERQRFLQSLIQHTPAIIYVKDQSGRFLLANQRFCEVAGKAERDIVGRHDSEIFGDAVATDISTNDRLVFDEDHSIAFEERLLLPDGPRVFISTKTPVEGVGFPGKVLLGVSVDITARKQAEQALQEADRRKDEFLATLAHELRNPLAAIRMALGVLHGGDARVPSAAQVANMQAIIDRQSEHLVRLIDDLLDLSRITRGKITLQRQQVDLRTVVEQAIESMRGAAEVKSVTLSVTKPETPVPTDVDSLRFVQVITNLLSNAIKFTDPGGQISVVIEHDVDARVRIRDSGIGISDVHLPRIFEMFTQFHGKGTGGLGIGLSLAKTIVDLHGGTLTAQSDGPGRGSEFVVRIPVPTRALPVLPAGVDGAAQSTSIAGRAQALRVLAVDDNVDALEAVRVMLEMAGHVVVTATNGQDALAIAGRERPDVVLLDIGLPDIDGYGVARRIRAEPWGREPRLLAMTGWGQDKDKRAAADAGFDAHLTKPVDATTLLQTLNATATATAVVPSGTVCN